ncbi:MAG TPA: hypothetical protein HA227_00085, partial [Candidatus Diapherotrites archaeon]|nr:hypothetical protein [Candidatus Diapherotrites archaeon]
MEKIIVAEKKFLASFGEKQHASAKNYISAKELYKSVKNVSEIARTINHPGRTVHEWLVQERAPRAIRALNYLKSIGLVPLRIENTRKFCFFTELVAFLFGDGSLMKDLGSFKLFGQEDDLKKIASEINELYGIFTKLNYSESGSEITKLRNGVIYKSQPKGGCWNLEVHSAQLSRLLYLAGAPLGDKVSSSTKVPEWVMLGDKELKRTFLSVLFGNELGCPVIRAKNAFVPAQFGLHKIESKEADLIEFLNQVKLLLNEFGISTSPILLEKCRTVRKDGNLSRKVFFYIDGKAPNILKLFKEIPFKYAEQKQRKFSNAVESFLKNSQNLEEEWKIYEKVIQ